jgi:hypothetical protein
VSLESVLYSRMTGWAPLTALVDDRIYRIRAPQPVIVPFVTHERISADRFAAMEASPDTPRPEEPLNTRIQIDCWAASDDDVREIAHAVIGAFESWLDPGSNPEIFGAEIENDQDKYDADADLYRAIIDVMISHRQG